jgi:ABC-2 type transport system ATP-binding protein
MDDFPDLASSPPPAQALALALEAKGLSKTYRAQGGQPEKQALKAVDLAIPRGSIFGLLGPNGAGKSTFINIFAGLVLKSAGTGRIWGHDIDAEPLQARALIGVVPQELNLDPFFTPRETLEFQAGLYGVPKARRRTMEILSAVGLADKADTYSRTLSGGMRRRMLVAKALVHNPPVLVLDEPTAGVDIELRNQLWAYVRALNRAGTTVVLTTHYLREAEELCDRIAIIARGEVIACDTTRALLARIGDKQLVIRPATPLSSPPAALAAFRPELKTGGELTLTYKPRETRLDFVLDAVRAAGIGIEDLTTVEPDLEDVFLDLTRRHV